MAKHAIMPDIHAITINYPTSRLIVNDSGAKSTAEAIFEVKTFTFSACKSRYNFHNTTINH
eukprot:scaffold4879_cov71-Cyclotella_meneghiniana.AAC.13